MPLISQSEYARSKNVSRQRIGTLVKQGILPLKNRKIDTKIADTIWDEIQSRKDIGGMINDTTSNSELSRQYLAARTRNEELRGKILEAEAKAKAGELVSADEVAKVAFDTARTVRDNILNIPDRIVPLLAATDDTQKLYKILNKELRMALETLSFDKKIK